MRAIYFVVAALLSGCSATTSAPAPGAKASAPPMNYRASVAQSVRETFYDPYSIRDAAISQPLYASGVFDGITPIPRKGWIICVRANSKNRMGGYVGLQQSVYLFAGERIDYVLSGPDSVYQVQDHCKTAAYEAFSEIEQPEPVR